jgi:thymidylate synthase (FAD)
MPIFVMRQHVRHRTATINEYSGRYSEMSNECYMPERDYLQQQSTSNKQGRADNDSFISEHNKHLWEDKQIDVLSKAYRGALDCYRDLLDENLARELARSVLPVANYTELYWKINLHNFFHYCKLRMDPHAQQEIRDYATAMFKLVERQLPLACEAFKDYIFEAQTFSKQEVVVLRKMLDTIKKEMFLEELKGPEAVERYGMTRRELDEFAAKIK